MLPLIWKAIASASMPSCLYSSNTASTSISFNIFMPVYPLDASTTEYFGFEIGFAKGQHLRAVVNAQNCERHAKYLLCRNLRMVSPEQHTHNLFIVTFVSEDEE
jgi:hypothetical protein